MPIPELDTPSKPEPSPKNADAVMIPVNVASPCFLMVTPTPVSVSYTHLRAHET